MRVVADHVSAGASGCRRDDLADPLSAARVDCAGVRKHSAGFVADVLGMSHITIIPQSDFDFAKTAGWREFRRLTAGF